MKHLLIILHILAFTSCGIAQNQYSTSSKKAISYFEEAMKAPNSRSEITGQPKYQEGIDLLLKALEKDPKFWEAHLLSAEFEELSGHFPSALDHYEAAIRINPNHSQTDATYYYASNILFQMDSNGGTRTMSWWREAAKFFTVDVQPYNYLTFSIDGLEDGV